MKLDRLKELMAKPNMSTVETGEYLALVRELLPGLLRVCDAYVNLLIAHVEGQCATSGLEIYVESEKKLKELLG